MTVNDVNVLFRDYIHSGELLVQQLGQLQEKDRALAALYGGNPIRSPNRRGLKSFFSSLFGINGADVSLAENIGKTIEETKENMDRINEETNIEDEYEELELPEEYQEQIHQLRREQLKKIYNMSMTGLAGTSSALVTGLALGAASFSWPVVLGGSTIVGLLGATGFEWIAFRCKDDTCKLATGTSAAGDEVNLPSDEIDKMVITTDGHVPIVITGLVAADPPEPTAVDFPPQPITTATAEDPPNEVIVRGATPGEATTFFVTFPDTDAPQDGAFSLIAQVNGGKAPFQYDWLEGGEPLASGDSVIIDTAHLITAKKPGDTALITLTVTDAEGKQVRHTGQVTIKSLAAVCRDDGGFWYNDTCNSTPETPGACDPDVVKKITDSSECSDANGAWSGSYHGLPGYCFCW